MGHFVLKPKFSLFAFATAVVISSPSFAQTTPPPDAGQVLRENQQQKQLPVTPRPTLSVPDEKDPGANAGQTVDVKIIRIENAVNLNSNDLHKFVADLEGRTVTIGQLREGARKITAHYRELGFVVARAFIPAQEITDGTVIIQILEGTLVSGRIDNHSTVKESVLQSVLDAQDLNGKVIASSTTDRGLLLLADLPAVGKVSGKLKPGEKVGTSDLIVSVDEGKRVEGLVGVDTYGNRYTGQNRLNGHVAFNSPAHLGDRLDVSATVTDESLLYGRIAYDLPVTGNGLRVGAAVSSSTYELGQEFEDLDATGTADTSGLYASYPILRGLNQNIWLTANYEHRKLEDEIKSVQSIANKTADVTSLEIFGDLVDALGGGGYSTWRIAGAWGDLSIDTPAVLKIDQEGARTDGSYNKWTLSASRLQAITNTTSISLAVTKQLANKNLDSSEKFLIGGIYGARAYPQGEGSGDVGWLANVELRHQLYKNLQIAAFYDTGHIDFDRTIYTANREDLNLRSYGFTTTASYNAFLAKLTIAWRAGTDEATTSPDKNPRVWGSVSYNF